MLLKKILLFSCFFFLLPLFVLAQTTDANNSNPSETIFQAQVVKILAQKITKHDDGTESIQQKLQLVGLEKKWKGEKIIFDGTIYDVISAPQYKVGDKVIMSYSETPEGEGHFYVTGFVRQSILYWLMALFALIVIIIGHFKGLRALLALFISFLIILKFIIPQILAGANPLWIGILGSFFILLLVVYITEGLKRNSTIAIAAITLSLIITGFLSAGFSALAKLTGFSSDEASYLMDLAGGKINIKGLLLAGIIIGVLGVLDDVVVSQVALVQELKEANPNLSKLQLYTKAMKVGVSHLSSMVNTLFLAYAGVSLPLLILFSIKQPPFLTFSQVINNEIVATEIVRTFAGSIGIVLAVPLATLLATKFVKTKMK